MDGAALMRDVVAAFEKSDMQPLFDAIHEDIVWKAASFQEGVFRFGGEYKGRAGVQAVMGALSQAYHFYKFVPKDVIASSDVVWGHFDVSLLFDPKREGEAKRHATLDMAFRWKLKDGKIIEHQGYFDTAALLAQQGRGVLGPAG